MENNLNELSTELFSQILLNLRIPLKTEIAPLKEPIKSGVGPFVSDGENYAYDLRDIAIKGSLSHSHPLYIKSLINSVASLSATLSRVVLSDENSKFLNKEFCNFKHLQLVNFPHESCLKYTLTDYHNKKKLENDAILLDDWLFTSSSSLIEMDVFKNIKAQRYYINLGIGLYISLNSSFSETYATSLASALINPFLNFYQVVLINKGNGRLSEISRKLSSLQTSVYGCHVQFKDDIENKPIVKSNNDDFCNVPTSITDEQLDHLLEILNE